MRPRAAKPEPTRAGRIQEKSWRVRKTVPVSPVKTSPVRTPAVGMMFGSFAWWAATYRSGTMIMASATT